MNQTTFATPTKRPTRRSPHSSPPTTEESWQNRLEWLPSSPLRIDHLNQRMMTPGSVLTLQRLIGNAAVVSLLRRSMAAPSRMMGRQLPHTPADVFLQRTVDEQMARANWPNGAQDVFRQLVVVLDGFGWDEPEEEALVRQTNSAELLRVVGLLGADLSALLLDLNMRWNEIRYYEQRLGAQRVVTLGNEYFHGTQDQAHLGNRHWLAKRLRQESDRQLQAPGANPFDVNTMLASLTHQYPADAFAIANGLIRINNGVELHPQKIDELAPDDLRQVVEATRTLADPAALQPARAAAQQVLGRFGTSGVQRFRYPANAVTALNFITPLIPAANLAAFNGLWNAATDQEKFRAYDLYNNYQRQPRGASNVNAQAADYAMRQNPNSIPDFVNHFEFYYAHFKERTRAAKLEILDRKDELMAGNPGLDENDALNQAREEVTGDPTNTTRNAHKVFVNQAMGGATLSAHAANEVQTAHADYAAQLAGLVGTIQLNVNAASPRTRGLQLKHQANNLMFSNVTSAAYHVRKHYRELPPNERPGPHTTQQKVQNFIASARLTIATGIWSYQGGQRGGEAHYFRRADMRAIVFVNPNAQAFITTYMSG